MCTMEVSPRERNLPRISPPRNKVPSKRMLIPNTMLHARLIIKLALKKIPAQNGHPSSPACLPATPLFRPGCYLSPMNISLSCETGDAGAVAVLSNSCCHVFVASRRHDRRSSISMAPAAAVGLCPVVKSAHN